MAGVVYILSALTCLACALLLGRGYARTKSRLLLWSCLCFTGLFANNALLFLDLVVYTQKDLSLWRSLAALVALSLLLIGLIWESE